jgi:hypothetical protein
VENSTRFYSNPDEALEISDLKINSFGELYADKWIEDIKSHFDKYSSAEHAPSLSYPRSLSNDNHIQKTKSFSGDVSGVIGETLFAIVLSERYNLTYEHVAHFRAHKSIGIYPDFGIYSSIPEFDDALKKWEINFPFQHPFPCEVKTVTTIDKGTIIERLHKAIGQVQNYWVKYELEGSSIICVCLRNPHKNSYDLHFIWGE